MDVYDAVTSRRSVRRFLDTPVPDDLLTRVVSTALRAPSCANLQPWNAYVVSGAALSALKDRVRERIDAGDRGDPPQVPPYPSPLSTVYEQRLREMGATRYGALGIAHDDWDARLVVRAENWQCFGAPAALFVYLDEALLPPQWMDVGIFLQTVMLLVRSESLDSCAQIAWAEYHQTVADVLAPPHDHVLATGMAIGYADPDEPTVSMPRANPGEVVTFLSD